MESLKARLKHFCFVQEWMPVTVKMEETLSNESKQSTLGVKREPDCSDQENDPLSSRRKKRAKINSASHKNNKQKQKPRVVAEVVQQSENVIIFQLDDRQGDDHFDDDFYQVHRRSKQQIVSNSQGRNLGCSVGFGITSCISSTQGIGLGGDRLRYLKASLTNTNDN